MIPLFAGSGGWLLTLLYATLPVLVSVQVRETLAVNACRRRSIASPRSASIRGLVKALQLHPLTVSFTIEVTADDWPVLTVVRHLSKGEVDSIADWSRTVQQTYTLQPESQQ